MATVLVLDDREADRDLMATLVGHAGHRVIRTATADDALTAARAERPDLIVTDILMPGTNGYEFVHTLREESEVGNTPVIFCTATYVQQEVERLAAACGVTRFIEKPYDPREVLELVSIALGAPAEPPTAPAQSADEFEREQARVLNEKLVEKVDELEAVAAARRRLLAQLIQAQEDERSRIADDLHDDSIQAIYAVGLRLELLAPRLDSDDDRELLERTRATVSTAIGRLRNLLFELRPPELGADGVGAATASYLATVGGEETFEYEVDGDLPEEAAPATKIMLYRSVREALMNVRKHALARNVAVQYGERERGYFATVTDDGTGFRPDDALRGKPGHLGLPAMRERIESAGGWLEVASEPGAGCRIDIWLPADTTVG